MIHEDKVAASDKLQQIFGTNNIKHITCSWRHNANKGPQKQKNKTKHETADSVPRERNLYLEFSIMQLCTAIPTAI